jgi:hypothetical protein
LGLHVYRVMKGVSTAVDAVVWSAMRQPALLFLPFVVACSGSSPAGAPDAAPDTSADASAPTPDSGADVAADAPSNIDAGNYPAFPPSGLPQVVNNGGATLTMPTIVTVTWTADTNAATYDALGDAIGGSAYWSATTSEYGIGAATSGTANHVHITTAPPTTMSDTALDTFIADQVGGAPGSGWPVNTAQTEYVLYLPETMELTSAGQNACNSEEGYHDETSTKTIAHIVYAVIVESCHGTQDVVQYSTETSSHEMVESATDPHVESDLAWTGFDADHWDWELWQAQQDELADACEYFPDAYYSEPALSNDWLQRTWSNAKAAAGHNPCVPAAPGAYFNTTPLAVVPITVANGKASVMTKGYSIPVGMQSTIQLGLYSDAPAPAWSVQVVEGDGFTTPSTSHVTITQSAMTGANGDTIDVSITTKVAKAAGVLVTAISSATGQPNHYMPLLVATE